MTENFTTDNGLPKGRRVYRLALTGGIVYFEFSFKSKTCTACFDVCYLSRQGRHYKLLLTQVVKYSLSASVVF